MASMDSAFGGSGEGGFEPDDFYESFLAPKFHDFTAPEEPIDPDSYFLSKPGMLKKAFLTEEVKTVAPRIHKIQVAGQEALKAALVVSQQQQQQQQQAPPRSPVAAEKTVRVGIVKSTNTLSSPLKSKILKNGTSNTNSNSNSNSPAQQQHQQHQQHQLPMLEKPLKPTSLAKKLQASENDDPNSPLKTTSDGKIMKPALTRQRSQKATHEAEKPTLTRQRSSQKNLETTKPAIVLQADASDSSNNNGENECDQGRGALVKKEQVKSAVVVSNKPENNATCKTPVKETAQNHQLDVKRCTEIPGSPFTGGHHCKHARCAANDSNFASPVPTKKFLVAKKGTPGSIRKATTTPSHAGEEDVPSETSEESKESKDSAECEEFEECGVPKAKGHGQVSLTDAFNKMALEQSVVETQITMQAVTVVTTTSSTLTEVSIEEEDKKQSLTAENIRDWSRNSVNCEEKAVSTSESGAKSGRDSDQNPSGVALFLQVASDCLETIDFNKIDVPPTKKVAGKKRKTGEFVSAGASKKANCAARENNKAVARKVKDAGAASKAAKLKLKRLSVARRLSVVRSRPGVTNPRPFRLRTQERGALKEKEFMKKMEEHKAAKEGFNSAFQGLAIVEPKVPGKFLKSGHVFSATRAEPKEDKEVMKPTTLVAHKAPLFDHPFKPHRSTKKLTVPQEPKFHAVRGNRTCPSHILVRAA